MKALFSSATAAKSPAATADFKAPIRLPNLNLARWIVAVLMEPSAEAICGRATTPAAAMAPMAARRSMFNEVLERYVDERRKERGENIFHVECTTGEVSDRMRQIVSQPPGNATKNGDCCIPTILDERQIQPTSLVAGAKAAAEATRRAETTAENFMVDQN